MRHTRRSYRRLRQTRRVTADDLVMAALAVVGVLFVLAVPFLGARAQG
jgi:hypothetical protein